MCAHVVSEDYADCKVESLEVCQRQGDCPKVPRTTCTIITQNVTKEFPESKVNYISRFFNKFTECVLILIITVSLFPNKVQRVNFES